jgi:putative tricarboxylic transport membrane protein
VDGLLPGMAILIEPAMVGVILLGTLIGIIVGALPGLSGSTTAALLLPLTITMSPVAAVAFLGSIYCAANYGGSITAILVNAPGDPSSSATTFDGYPLAAQGKAGLALGISAISSAIGGVVSVFVLIVATPLLAKFAYNFGPPEYFALALFGLSMLGAVGGDVGLKNLISGTIGLLLATIGIELTTGIERFTFGIPELTDGLGFVPVLTGLFAMSELLVMISQRHLKIELLAFEAAKLPTRADFRKSAKSITIGCIVGTIIGILPALGATASALLAYNESKRWSKYKHEFGKGSIEGIAGPEAANNAAVGGAMVPTLALGIPGSTTAAIILAGMIIQGVRPGPHLFTEQPEFLYAVFASMLGANIIYLWLGLVAAKLFARISLIPPSFLWPSVFVLCVIGAYAPNQTMIDVWTMLIFGVVGYLMRRHGFSPAPLVMGLVLGQMVEESLKQSLVMFDQSWAGFFRRPMVVALFAITALSVGWPLLARLVNRLIPKGTTAG